MPEEDVEISIPERFEKIVRQHPEKVALKKGTHSLTYGQLNEAANQIAREILNRRGPKSEPIALLLDHGIIVLVAILGVLKAGKFYVAMDFSFSKATIQYIVENSAAALVIAYVIRFLAIAIGFAQAGFARIALELDDVARMLGAGPGTLARTIHLPLARPAVWGAALLVFVDCLKELPATLLLRPLNVETLSTHIYQFATRGSFEQGSLAALIIVAVGILPVIHMVKLADNAWLPSQPDSGPNKDLLWQLLDTTRVYYRYVSLIFIVLFGTIGTAILAGKMQETSSLSASWAAWTVATAGPSPRPITSTSGAVAGAGRVEYCDQTWNSQPASVATAAIVSDGVCGRSMSATATATTPVMRSSWHGGRRRERDRCGVGVGSRW
jgi:hypothetical protein